MDIIKIRDEMMSRRWLLIAIMLFGGFLVFTGLFRGILESRQVQVEYIENDEEIFEDKIIVDVEGGVINPGVYELSSGSRIKDAIVAAGGISSDANRETFVKLFNLAQLLKDGQKIYVPLASESNTGVGYDEHKNADRVININEASEQELDTLEGIGPARAMAIIQGRPYSEVDELVGKGVLSSSILEKIRLKIIVY
ncbi:MAG: Late competence protein comEA [Candidatus Collierbacteria bacterium GW2011_GWC2_45_15]|uniref:Late competence protein comEA n=1 Tax=Candidatus Collierbacteria bacterium GW2011_GWC2_45_15 TaxID=1618394 RepID=A0A0G1LR37_9BACT|nr:MAG: Late competence protein comEA [Candidatus Collierbacteria bacterium GW2011_GWC2_45_15]